MAMSIIVVEMAVQNLFLSVKHRGQRATHIAYLMSCHASIISSMSYGKKKTKPKSKTLFPSQTEV